MKVKNYEVWIEGTLGLHKGKPVMYGIYETHTKAQAAMHLLLKSGRYATIKVKESRLKNVQ